MIYHLSSGEVSREHFGECVSALEYFRGIAYKRVSLPYTRGHATDLAITPRTLLRLACYLNWQVAEEHTRVFGLGCHVRWSRAWCAVAILPQTGLGDCDSSGAAVSDQNRVLETAAGSYGS